MATTVSEIIALAQSTKALSTAQLQKILELAPKMTEAELESLKQMIVAVQAAEMKDMKTKIDLRQKIGSAYHEWKADKSRDTLRTQEGAVVQEDHAQAESLFQNI